MDRVAVAADAMQQEMEDKDRSRTAAEEFHVGDKVWLSLRSVRSVRESKKLNWLHAEYTVTKWSGLTYEINAARNQPTAPF
jgi:hypothetical protein